MKLDVLDDLEEIKICTGYKYRGRVYTEFPLDFEMLCKAVPVYEQMKGWEKPTQDIRYYHQLPVNARRYVERLEKLLKVRIRYISIGSRRDDTIIRF